MSRRTQHLCVVLLAQTGCLAVGLWMQHRFVRSAAKDDAVEQTWTELGRLARQAAPQLQHLSSSVESGRTEELARLERILTLIAPDDGGAIAVDNHWQVILASKSGDASRSAAGAGGRVTLTAPAATGEPTTSDHRGVLQGANGPHLAIAEPLPGDRGFVIVHRSRGAVEAHVGAVLASLPGISALTGLWTSALLGIATYMVLARWHDEAERERARTVADQQLQRQKLLRTRDAVIFGLAKLADSRDPETGDHLDRISVYSTTLAAALRTHPKYGKEVTSAFVRVIGISSALHDIGKVGIEDRILLKPGPLTPAERSRIQHHATLGGDCLREIEQRLGSSNFLQMAREIAFAHHERWDGTGYPRGLQGEDIPLAARIVAIADVYDALSSRRVYKGPRRHEECVEIIRNSAGKHFDAELVAVWLTLEDKFRAIALRYGNSPPEQPRTEPPSAAPEVEFATDKECLVAAVAGADA